MEEKGSKKFLTYCLTSIAHAIIIAVTVYNTIVCIEINAPLMAWHGVLFTIGVGFLMYEAILAISGDSFLSSLVARRTRVWLHVAFMFLGSVMVIGGCAVVYIYKSERDNMPNLSSDHGIWGYIGSLLCIVISLSGIPILYTKILSKIISPANLKVVHILGGIFAMGVMVYAQITGLYKGFWPGSDLGRDLSYAAYVVGLFMVCVIPLHRVMNRIASYFD